MFIVFIFINFSKMIIRIFEIKLWKNKCIDPTVLYYKRRELLKTTINITEVGVFFILFIIVL